MGGRPSGSKLLAAFPATPAPTYQEPEPLLKARFEGKPVPDFTVCDREGKDLKLSSLRGKVVVVDYWDIGCVPCRGLMHTIQEIRQRCASSDAAVLVVDTGESQEALSRFIKRLPQYTGCVLDPAGTDWDATIASRLYGVAAVPCAIIIDKEGILRTYASGVHPRDFYISALRKLGVQASAQ